MHEYIDGFGSLEFDITEEEKNTYIQRLLSLAKYREAAHSEFVNVLLRLLTFARQSNETVKEALKELNTFGTLDGYGTDLKHIIITGLYMAKCRK